MQRPPNQPRDLPRRALELFGFRLTPTVLNRVAVAPMQDPPAQRVDFLFRPKMNGKTGLEVRRCTQQLSDRPVTTG
jgi:hypothetical protein